jgi:uncharacterized membrane protein YfcA
MSFWDGVIIVLAGLAAGTINTVVGSGSLITFPTLLALGYPPVLANVSNNIGLVPGAISGVYGYRRELVGQRGRIVRLAPMSALGALGGALLLLVLPSAVFKRVVVVLIVVALVLVVMGPRLSRRLARAHEGHARIAPVLVVLVGLAGIYGGYFGAAQGVILLSLLGIFIADTLQRLNAVKNVLALIANGVAAVLFVFFADVAWLVVVLIAVGSVVGAQVGAHVGRRLPERGLRALIVVVGLVAAIKLLAT